VSLALSGSVPNPYSTTIGTDVSRTDSDKVLWFLEHMVSAVKRIAMKYINEPFGGYHDRTRN